MGNQVRSQKRSYRYPNRFTDFFDTTQLENDREQIFEIARALVQAQILLADKELTNRLWADVSERSLDERRIIHLMYRCTDHDDDESMLDADLTYIRSITNRS